VLLPYMPSVYGAWCMEHGAWRMVYGIGHAPSPGTTKRPPRTTRDLPGQQETRPTVYLDKDLPAQFPETTGACAAGSLNTRVPPRTPRVMCAGKLVGSLPWPPLPPPVPVCVRTRQSARQRAREREGGGEDGGGGGGEGGGERGKGGGKGGGGWGRGMGKVNGEGEWGR